MSSLLASAPIWKFVDPMVILTQAERDDEDETSLESILDKGLGQDDDESEVSSRKEDQPAGLVGEPERSTVTELSRLQPQKPPRTPLWPRSSNSSGRRSETELDRNSGLRSLLATTHRRFWL